MNKEVIKIVEEMGRNGLVVKVDVSNFEDAQNMVSQAKEKFGGVRILVCHAGTNWDGVIWKMT